MITHSQVRRDRLIPLAIAFFGFIVIGATPGILNIAWEYMRDTFKIGNDSLGVLLGAGTIGHLVSAFYSGRMIGTVGLYKFLLAGSLLAAVGALGFVLSGSFGILLVLVVVGSLGNGVIDAGMNSFVTSNYGRAAMNWLHAFFGVGLTIGPIFVNLVVEGLGSSWRWSYALIVVLQLVLATLFLLTRNAWKLPDFVDDAAPGEVVQSSSGVTIKQTLAVPSVMFSLILFLVYGGVEIGTGQLLNTLFTEGRGIAQTVSSSWVSFYWLSFTIGRMFVGSIGERMSNTTMMRVSMWGTVIGMFMLWVNLTDAFGFMGLAIVGFSLAPMFATLTAETPRRVGRRHVANAIGFQLGMAGLGGAILPGIGGIVAEYSGPEAIALFLFVNALILIIVHEYILFREARQVLASTTAD